MTTWNEVCRHLADGHEVVDAGPSWMALVWRFPRSAGEAQVRQPQHVELMQLGGRPHVVSVCAVVPHVRLSAADALAHNLGLAVGALALLEDTVVIRSAVALDDLELRALDRTLEATAHEAARLRGQVVARPAPADLSNALGHWL